jgi:8-oxo-dGTP pyrophosphatase MutT (NUDIX family)
MSVVNGDGTTGRKPVGPAHPAPHPSQRHPRDAATIILVDRSGAAPRVLLGKRNPAMAFLPNCFVFPGGRVEPSDGRIAAHGTLPAHVERRILGTLRRPSATRARAFPLAAIRELSEETGLLLGVQGAALAPRHPDWQAFAEHGIRPTLDDIWLIGRAVTPPGMPRRYDTRVFAADAARVAHRIDGVVTPQAELVELRWMGFDETAEHYLHPITRVILRELEARMEAGISRDMPVPFFRSRAGAMVRDEI